jgi:hypothetical protein
VNETLYFLDAKTLSRTSVMFQEMFHMPMGRGIDGLEGTDEKPIVIPEVEEAEFDLFVAQAYGQ